MKPLIACTTTEDGFCNRVESAANEIGTEFWSSPDVRLMFRECVKRRNCCMVVDYENTNGLRDRKLSLKVRDSRTLLVVIPRGDVRAAFQSASAGAINVIEKPFASDELIINLKTALASDSRMEEYRESEIRFASPFFNALTKREKEILSLLMDGEPNKRVAAILDIGLRTVEAERAQVMRKLQVSSFVELIKQVAGIERDFLETRKEIFGSMLPKTFGILR